MKQLYIFDYDGVIADSLDSWITVIESKGEQFSHEYRMTRENVNDLEYVTMEGILEKSGKKREEEGEYLSEIYGAMARKSEEIKFFDGIGEVFKIIHESGNIVCVNTANGSSLVARRLKDENMGNYVDEVIGGDLPGSKSEKICFLMDKYSFSPENSWMIGDTRGDIIEGRKAGVHTVAVTYGWHSYENMIDTEPDYIFRTVKELKDFFCEKFSAHGSC